jgi:type II secretory pathway component PulK
MQNNISQQARRSLGALRKAAKTKPRSPDAQGAMKVQRHTIETIMRQLEDSDADEITANIAGWYQEDHSGRYITVELSPRYVSRQKVQREKPINMFESFFQEKENFH